jgi:ribosomal-protein-serine acetyltransferase
MPGLTVSGNHELRLLDESDAEELYGLIDSNRGHLARWMAWAESQTLEQTAEFISTTRTQLISNDGFQTAITAAGRIVGMVGFRGVDWQNRGTSIGYWLAAAEQGHGTMTCAVRALVDHALTQWRLNRVELRIDIENHGSRSVAERLRFVQEGTLRQAIRLADGYHDDAVYSMLAADWAMLPPAP